MRCALTVVRNHNATNVVVLANVVLVRGKIAANYTEDQPYVPIKEEKLKVKILAVEVFVCIRHKREVV